VGGFLASPSSGYGFAGTLASPSGNCAGGSCNVAVQGSLFGPGASHLGVGYTIGGLPSGRTISGVGAFRQGAPIAVP
jgi:hypothetical protein